VTVLTFLSALITVVVVLILLEVGFYLSDVIVRKMSNLAVPGSVETEEE
jgi:hypothetical protein